MKVLGITSYRCGSGYCFESISQLLGNTYLNEIFSQAVPPETYTYTNGIIKLNFEALESDYDRLSVNSDLQELYKRIDWLINSKNNWVAKIHIDQLLKLDTARINHLLSNVTPVLLYRENTYERILSMILAFEMNKYRFGQDETVPNITVDYNYEKHKYIISRIIESEQQLLDIYNTHCWYKIYTYENLTHDPNQDFALFGNKSSIKTPKISFIDKERRVTNADKLREDFKWKNLKILK